LPGYSPRDEPNWRATLKKIMLRLTMIGAVYITLVCLLPEFLVVKWNVTVFTLVAHITVDALGGGNDGLHGASTVLSDDSSV